MSSPVDVSVIIVSWNVSDLLDVTLATIKKYTTSCTYEVIVVDNASVDDSVAMVEKKYPWVQLINPGENLGFGKANNLGLSKALGKYILYLNPDIELIEDAIGPMLEFLEKNPQDGLIGPKLLNSDHSHQNSVGNFPTLHNLFAEYVRGEKALAIKNAHPTKIKTVDAVLGACILGRGELIRQLGGFDERYFMYLEETDMCLNAKKLGFNTIYFPDVAMVHHSGKSSGYSDESRQRSLHENRRSQLLFFRKNYSALTAQAAKTIIFVVFIVRLPFIAVLALVTGQAKRRFQLKYYKKTLGFLFLMH
jgi:GT2 family glycosyltransferase